MGFTETELSILIVDDEGMRQINWEYRRIDQPTDVLSFPMLEGEFADVCPDMLGDVAISAETALGISEETGAPFDAVMALLLVHGILHLLGHDHLAGGAEAQRMEEKTSSLLRELGYEPGAFDWFFE